MKWCYHSSVRAGVMRQKAISRSCRCGGLQPLFFFSAWYSGIPRWLPMQVLTRPDPAANLPRSDKIGNVQGGMTIVQPLLNHSAETERGQWMHTPKFLSSCPLISRRFLWLVKLNEKPDNHQGWLDEADYKARQRKAENEWWCERARNYMENNHTIPIYI